MADPKPDRQESERQMRRTSPVVFFAVRAESNDLCRCEPKLSELRLRPFDPADGGHSSHAFTGL
jgi:hypothetical protein